jgi:hypothetical protein
MKQSRILNSLVPVVIDIDTLLKTFGLHPVVRHKLRKIISNAVGDNNDNFLSFLQITSRFDSSNHVCTSAATLIHKFLTENFKLKCVVPHKSPSSFINLRAIGRDSRSFIFTHSSTTDLSNPVGIKSYPTPSTS